MATRDRGDRPAVAILGGGLTGAAVAYHLARAGADLGITVVEPRAELGRGLAYASADPAHRINVPAAKMTLISADPGHFADWLAAAACPLSPRTATPSGDLFPERRIFGDYVAAQLAPFLASGAIHHLRGVARAVARDGDGYRIETSSGARVADFVVLAMSHHPPRPPGPFAALRASDRVIADPYAPAAADRIGPAERVLILGSGLTSADVIASLDQRGFRGEILVLSRRGLRSRGHAPPMAATAADFLAPPARTTRDLLRRVRAAVAAEAGAGRSWHPTLDRLREQGPAIWQALPPLERARLLRHLRVFWDVHRFRVAPMVEERLDALVAKGRLRVVAARLLGASETAEGIVVDYHVRGAPAPASARFDRIVIATGPAHDAALTNNPALASLAAAGLIASDPLGLGIATTAHCRAAGPEGRAVPGFFVAGPLARGHVGELMGVPEVITHAEAVARAVLADARLGTAATIGRGAARAPGGVTT